MAWAEFVGPKDKLQTDLPNGGWILRTCLFTPELDSGWSYKFRGPFSITAPDHSRNTSHRQRFPWLDGSHFSCNGSPSSSMPLLISYDNSAGIDGTKAGCFWPQTGNRRPVPTFTFTWSVIFSTWGFLPSSIWFQETFLHVNSPCPFRASSILEILLHICLDCHLPNTNQLTKTETLRRFIFICYVSITRQN